MSYCKLAVVTLAFNTSNQSPPDIVCPAKISHQCSSPESSSFDVSSSFRLMNGKITRYSRGTNCVEKNYGERFANFKPQSPLHKETEFHANKYTTFVHVSRPSFFQEG